METMRRRKEAGKSLWRISSTCFCHVASDQVRAVPFELPRCSVCVFRVRKTRLTHGFGVCWDVTGCFFVPGVNLFVPYFGEL